MYVLAVCSQSVLSGLMHELGRNGKKGGKTKLFKATMMMMIIIIITFTELNFAIFYEEFIVIFLCGLHAYKKDNL